MLALLDAADEAWGVLVSRCAPDTKSSHHLSESAMCFAAFGRKDLGTCNSVEETTAAAQNAAGPNTVVLLMSSGRFEGADLQGAIQTALDQ